MSDAMDELARFFVPGIPMPQGSKSAFTRVVDGKPKAVLVEGRRPRARAEFRAWRECVAMHARDAWVGIPPYPGPVFLSVVFVFPRPKLHFGRRGLKASYGARAKATAPDLDKLVRALCDSLTGTVLRDDRTVVGMFARKRYAAVGEPSGAFVDLAAAYPDGSRAGPNVPVSGPYRAHGAQLELACNDESVSSHAS